MDYFVSNNEKISTFAKEQYECSKSNSKLDKQYNRINGRIIEADDYNELKSMYEIKELDHKTGLKELKMDSIRVIHFLYLDSIFVFLGTFIKKTKKTPQNIIDKNNKRIREYLKQRRIEENNDD